MCSAAAGSTSKPKWYRMPAGTTTSSWSRSGVISWPRPAPSSRCWPESRPWSSSATTRRAGRPSLVTCPAMSTSGSPASAASWPAGPPSTSASGSSPPRFRRHLIPGWPRWKRPCPAAGSAYRMSPTWADGSPTTPPSSRASRRPCTAAGPIPSASPRTVRPSRSCAGPSPGLSAAYALTVPPGCRGTSPSCTALRCGRLPSGTGPGPCARRWAS